MELLDIVDNGDSVIGQATREEAYGRSLALRIVHVLIFDGQGRMILQKRSEKVSFCPGYWSTAVGGHVQSGETYEEAALREYQEELGVVSGLEHVGKDLFVAPGKPDKFVTTFKTQYDGTFEPDAEEVSEVRAFDIAEIKRMMEDGEKFHPELVFILKRYF